MSLVIKYYPQVKEVTIRTVCWPVRLKVDGFDRKGQLCLDQGKPVDRHIVARKEVFTLEARHVITEGDAETF